MCSVFATDMRNCPAVVRCPQFRDLGIIECFRIGIVPQIRVYFQAAASTCCPA